MKNIIEGYNELIFNFFEYAWVAIIRATVFLNDLIAWSRFKNILVSQNDIIQLTATGPIW